MSSKHPHITNE